MRAIVQRVQNASVAVDGQVVGSCGPGLVLLVGVHRDDDGEKAKKLADRIVGLRIFNDADGKMNLSLSQVEANGAQILAVSNFTVYGDSAKSKRPSFVASAPFELGRELFDQFLDELRKTGTTVESGIFGADMQVSLVNDGPVTVIVES